jgi:hypothetical protein
MARTILHKKASFSQRTFFWNVLRCCTVIAHRRSAQQAMLIVRVKTNVSVSRRLKNKITAYFPCDLIIL